MTNPPTMRSAEYAAKRWMSSFYHMAELNPDRATRLLELEIQKAMDSSYNAAITDAAKKAEQEWVRHGPWSIDVTYGIQLISGKIAAAIRKLKRGDV